MAPLVRPVITFVVPTLNRARYVVRAVRSALVALDQCPQFTGEVVVLDSQSDDGSWEALNEVSRVDPRVRCMQNARGLGPTRSWLDGAAHVTGDYVTFLWSDDYIAPHFVSTLGTLIHEAQANVVIGRGVLRDVDDESALPDATHAATRLPTETVLETYIGLGTGFELPVSPACALFSRSAFEAWKELVADFSRKSPIREWLMWRRAIGPDLLLFLVAATLDKKPTILSDAAVAQFSSHPTSITVASSGWPLTAGYWLATLWAVDAMRSCGASARRVESGIARLLAKGFELLVKARVTERESVKPEHTRALEHELGDLWRSASLTHGTTRMIRSLVAEGSNIARRRARRFIM